MKSRGGRVTIEQHIVIESYDKKNHGVLKKTSILFT